MAWEKFINTRGSRGSAGPVGNLKIGECYFMPQEFYPNVYSKLRYHLKKHNKDFETLKCTNGIVIRRIK